MKKLLLLNIALLLSAISTIAQCDFINDITGLSMTTPPSGNAADPLQYTHVYVLVDSQGQIVATSSTPDFAGLNADLYYIYSVNYSIAEAGTIGPLLNTGMSFSPLQSYSGCIDIAGPAGGCSISVCDQISVPENSTLVNPATGYSTTGSSEMYCLVCSDQVIATNTTGTFDLSLYPAAAPGADCQIVSVNYQSSMAAPFAPGDTWSTIATGNCSQADCWEYLGRQLDITPLLSVELYQFYGVVEQAFNDIHWSTFSEKNNNHFVLQRSEDGENFTDVATIQGNGTTQDEKHYQYKDFEIRDILYYYRLKIVDYDGQIEYSQSIALLRDNSSANGLIAFPVPMSDLLNISFSTNSNSHASVELRSIDGKLIAMKQFDCLQGNNNLSIDVSSLAKGAYIVSVYVLGEKEPMSQTIFK